jgi:hypothetical protein
MTNSMSTTLSSRQKTDGPNHHLWNNHGTWWFHGTFHKPEGTKERVRLNLHTRDLAEARLKRDRIASQFGLIAA